MARIEEAIKEYKITNPSDQQRLAARPRSEVIFAGAQTVGRPTWRSTPEALLPEWVVEIDL
jgi:hypothetical protein